MERFNFGFDFDCCFGFGSCREVRLRLRFFLVQVGVWGGSTSALTSASACFVEV